MKTTILIFLIILIGCNNHSTAVLSKNDEGYFAKELGESKSPNRKRKLYFGERGSDTTGWTTQVLLNFGDCGGGIYSASGHGLNIKAYWKGNDTIVIETKSEYSANQKNDSMQCFSEKVNIVYIER